MELNVENLGALKRRLDISITQERIQAETGNRLKKLAKTTKIHGFRPGKVPLNIITQKFGIQVQQDVLSDAINDEFNEAIKKSGLPVAGYPHFEIKQSGDDSYQAFSATFEVYPEISLGDLGQHKIERPIVQIADSDIDKTLDIIRKQRISYQTADRPANHGDRVKIDYHGVIDGKDFSGGKAENVYLTLGDGKFLKDFETALIGMKVGEDKSFDVVFPEDYHGKDIAGKTVTFTVKLHEIEIPVLPEINAEFAMLLGIPDGDIQKMREGIRLDLEREISKRVRAKLKEQVMQSLLDTTPIEAPSVLVSREVERLMQNARSDLEARGMKAKEIPLSPDLFKEKAEYRIKLGLILAELIKVHHLKALPEHIRSVIEEAALSYENPEQVIKWHYASPERLQEAESLALEENVVRWALEKVKIADKAVTFDELMGIS
ncbi:MAG: trigger factor [Pseudomonadota bacterium]